MHYGSIRFSDIDNFSIAIDKKYTYNFYCANIILLIVLIV